MHKSEENEEIFKENLSTGKLCDSQVTAQISKNDAFWNICNTIQGLPILSIPYVIQCGGLVSLLSLIVISCTSCYTASLLVACMYLLDDEGRWVRVYFSFSDIGDAVLCHGGKLVLIIQAVQLILICSLYPFIVGSVLETLLSHLGVPLRVWILFSGIFFTPNVFVANLSQITWTSVVVMLSSGFIFVSISTYCIANTELWSWEGLLTFSPDLFPAAVMLLLTSYFSQPFVPVIEESMKNREKFNSILVLSYCSMTFANIVMGVIACVTFFPETKEVATNNLPPGPLRIVLALVAVVLSFASFTLPMFTLFDVFEQFYSVKYLSEKDSRTDYSHRIIYRCLLTLVAILLGTLPKYSYIVAFFGCLTGTSLEIIFPTIFHIKLCYDRMSVRQVALDFLVLVFGITMVCFGVYFSARTIVLKESVSVPPHLHQHSLGRS